MFDPALSRNLAVSFKYGVGSAPRQVEQHRTPASAELFSLAAC